MSEELSTFVRELPNRVLNTKQDERIALFQDISIILSNPGVTSTIVRGLCKVIGITVTKYKDKNSQALVKKLLVDLLAIHHDLAIEHLMALFKVLVNKELHNAPPVKAAEAAVVVLDWSIAVVKHARRDSNVFKAESSKLLDYQALLYTLVLQGVSRQHIDTGERMLLEFWHESNDIFLWYYKITSAKEQSIATSLLLMLLWRYHSENQGKPSSAVMAKDKVYTSFTKTFINGKIKPHPNYILACSCLLKTTTQEEFEEHILPSLQKSMLRSPELTLQAVGQIIQEVNLDFSDYALQLGKTLLRNLCTKDDAVRSDAVKSLKCLAIKCSKAEAIEALLKNIFEILNGSDGKITVAEYRMNLLQGAGNLSFNCITSDELIRVMDLVTVLFGKTLKSEIQEKVICHALDMFSLWSANYKGELPTQVVDIFKHGLELKTTTQQVRLSYMQWLLATLENAFLKNNDFTKFLLTIYEKSLSNPTQISVVSEAICAACIILKTNQPLNDTKFSYFCSTIFDMNKQIFFSERFLQNAPSEMLSYVMLLAGILLTEQYDKLKGSLRCIYKAIVNCITSNTYKVREFFHKVIPYIINAEHKVEFICNILRELENSMENLKIQNDIEHASDGGSSTISPRALVENIRKLFNITNLDVSEANALALQSFIVCHHSALLVHDADFWQNIVTQSLKIELKDFILKNVQQITDNLVINFQKKKSYENAVTTIIHLAPEIMLSKIMESVYNYLNEPDLINITDEEFFTYLTPEGELYDKSVVPNSDEIYHTAGMKRENKVYSYKEQIEEIQLRREIDEKRRKEGKSKTQQYTPKQQEAIKNQMDKERLIRHRLNILNDKLLTVISLVKAACDGNAKQVSLHFCCLLQLILKALGSPLAAEPLSELYYFLRTACFDHDHSKFDLSHTLSTTTLRLVKPHCDLPIEWTQSELTEAIIASISRLDKFTFQDEDHEQTQSGRKLLLEAPSFSYAFEFLKRAIETDMMSCNEELLLVAIKLIERHCQLRGETVVGEIFDYTHPKYLPRLEMFRLFMYVISKHRGHIQTQAITGLLELATASSGNDYCATASEAEITFLLTHLENDSGIIRDIVLRALKIMAKAINTVKTSNAELSEIISRRLWVAKFDNIPENGQLANNLWDTLSPKTPLPQDLTSDVIHPQLCIQKAASRSLAFLCNADPELTTSLLKNLLKIYRDKLTMIPPKLDMFDREIQPAIDQWMPRRGVAIAISQLAQFLSLDDVNYIMQFMVSQGLGDREEIVHKEMLASALVIVDIHGKDAVIKLLPVFEDFLDKAPKSQNYDNVRQAVVILVGSLARHLEKNDNRIEPIVRRLLSALSTPSQQVQEAVANCLPHLMPSVKDEAPAMIKKLLQQLVKSEKYGERRGAAYGIAGIVKGLGILSLKQLDIMSKLTMFIQEKKNYKSREGALFAFEVLCATLGRLFEPYIVHILPYLLQCFGDSSQYVRQAADDTAKVVMGRLSAHGVKLVLPSLLDALDEDSWRTKTASVELLGAMAFCAPKQLSSCLPSIVPKLIEVLGDSHTKVQEAGAEALKVIGSVIKNPEIQAIVPVLLKALEDPSKNTSLCLQSLLQTKFVHFIDAPSLALIMPVVQRAFMDRSTETRKMAAQIIGNMYSLTDQKDLTPYLPSIIPGLKMSLLDPVPEVRAVSARALGAMVRGMGEPTFEDLLPWLMQTLTSESSSVDRSGAAQGLSEVVGGLGVEKLHKLMPDIIATAERNDIAPHVKDGYIMMFIYMPSTFSQEFTPYIGQIINPILKALADENEYVRDTALKAGQRIVNMYAETAVTLLLPELEKGLFDDNWRIRFSSVQLLGDLLYRISGVSGKMTTETASEDDNFGTEQSHAAIIKFLGTERRNRVLSGLYMGRSDVSLMVRQAALHVWKVVVTNTPRTLREILPTLFGLLLGCLASTSYDKRQVAARTLGDLVRKLGERVLPEIIPILEKGLNSDQSDQRQGVCIGLSEIMASTSKEMVLTFVNSLVPTVRRALSDPLLEVRGAAAKTFESLHSTVGSRALDDILPSMLEGLSDPDPDVAENTLDGLRQVMSIKPKVVLPYLIPQLTASPINIKALSILVSVAGDALTKYLPKILAALLKALTDAQGTANEQQEFEYCQTVILSVSDEIGVRTILDILMIAAKSDNLAERKSAAYLLSGFCIHSPGDYSQYVPQLLRCLLRLMSETDKDILQKSWDALNAVIKGLDASQQIAHVSDVRQAVRFAASDLKTSELPGFCLPKGIIPLLPVFREAILNGMPEEKESAAQGLGEVISLTSAASLQPSVVHITGPLIRILGDRFNAGVKAAVLETLGILLHKVGVMLKQFLPQLQTTFLKALQDQNRLVRVRAGVALAELAKIHNRADPLFNDIHNNIKSGEDINVRETMFQALRGVISAAGDKLTEPLRRNISNTLLSFLGHSEDVLRSGASGCLGALLKYLPHEDVENILNNHILVEDNGQGNLKHGQSSVLFVTLKESPEMFLNSNHEENIHREVLSYITHDKVPIVGNGIRAITYILYYDLKNGMKTPQPLVIAFTRSMNHNSNEIKQLVAKCCDFLSKCISLNSFAPELMKYLIPMLVNGTKEKNVYVKSNSEIALLSMLHLNESEDIYLKVCEILEPGAKVSLIEVVSKISRKMVIPSICKDNELDVTVIV